MSNIEDVPELNQSLTSISGKSISYFFPGAITKDDEDTPTDPDRIFACRVLNVDTLEEAKQVREEWVERVQTHQDETILPTNPTFIVCNEGLDVDPETISELMARLSEMEAKFWTAQSNVKNTPEEKV